MKNDFITLRDRLRASYWFIPTIMAIMAFLLSILSVQADEIWGRQLAWVVGLVYVDSPEGARAVLSTVASSMITVAGTVFSLTMVVLQLTSQQYGPLVLSNFIRDRGNQFVLGIFTATFIYCLLVLRTIRGVGNSFFIPHISVLIGLGLAIASLGVLIYFIHHVSDSIRASTIITRLSTDLKQAIHNLYPEQLGYDAEEVSPREHKLPEDFGDEAVPVMLNEGGYLQLVDEGNLLNLANEHDLIVKIVNRPGAFMLTGAVAALVWPPGHVDEKVRDAINNALEIGPARTQEQDIEYLLNQLVAMAVRALSPSLNDPYTAMACIDRLAEILCLIGNRTLPSPYRYDEAGELRVIARPISFEEIVHIAFDEIWAYGHEDYRVRLQMQTMGDMLVQCLRRDEYKAIMRRYMTHHPLKMSDEPDK